MPRWKNWLFNIALALNALLVFLLLFESRLVIPAWLQVAGRMHPLLLHFPIVLVVLYALMMLGKPVKNADEGKAYLQFADTLLLLSAVSTVVTALMGTFLSREDGYDAEALFWHKWSGVALSLFTLIWYYFRTTLRRKKIITIITTAFALSIVIIAGHQGAGITHGQNFLFAPMMPEKIAPAISPEDAVVFADMIKPILESKCISCHNDQKAKGELIMSTEALLLKGGKTGLLWDTTAPGLGLLLQRVHLPIEQKKHMPPQGKPQLTEQEILIITQWIRKGSDFKLRVADLPEADTLRLIAQAMFAAASIASYDFEPADPSLIQELNSENRVVTEEAIGSPAITVSFFNSTLFKTEQLTELNKISQQIVSLDLSRMPISDAELKTIGNFKNLRRLNLGFTGISGNSLAELQPLIHLQTLTLSGTNVKANQLEPLKKLPALRVLHTWNSAVSNEDLVLLKKSMPQVRFEKGFKGDTMLLQLSPPVIQNEEAIITAPIPLKLKHYINGSNIHYTLDGSDPDSLSPVYKGTEKIDGNVLVRARAYKAGWISSEIVDHSFYKNAYTVDTLIFINQPDASYTGPGKLLTDRLKGSSNFRSGEWLAWRQEKMSVLLSYEKPVDVSSVTISTLLDIGGYLMPPFDLEIWGGDSPDNLKRLGRIVPPQPAKMQPPSMRGYECKFPVIKVRYLKVVATPVPRLPAWHPGKGDKGWIFVDEILVN